MRFMSFTPSKIITSPQQGIHANLEQLVSKHLAHAYRKPIADYNQRAFNSARDYWNKLGQPSVILDSACGTAESTRFLSVQYKHSLIIGLDQSAKRLANSENKNLTDNAILLRCDCTDFWRLAQQAKWVFEKHYLLYPNPYPKPPHLQRRWHGHPAFPNLLAISQQVELRTNWRLYAEEFAAALRIAGHAVTLNQHHSNIAITAFERKYQLSGHDLWCLSCHIHPDAALYGA